MIKNVIIAGVGGQGVVTAGLLMSEAATENGINVVMSEIHGLAQRGGSVSVDVRMGDVYGSIVPKGGADIIIGFEPIETVRALSRAGRETLVIMNTEKKTPISLSMHDKEYPPMEQLLKIAPDGMVIHQIDAVSLAKEAGNYRSVNTVILGAALALGVLPFSRENAMSALKRRFSGGLYEVNARALDLGIEEIKGQRNIA
ncbi:MAG: indolepyruvate oxidoreductase subunit beta [Thermoplasmataceae archaeon]